MKRFALVLNCVVSPFSTLQLINSSEKLDSKLELEIFFQQMTIEFLCLYRAQKIIILAFTVVKVLQR